LLQPSDERKFCDLYCSLHWITTANTSFGDCADIHRCEHLGQDGGGGRTRPRRGLPSGQDPRSGTQRAEVPPVSSGPTRVGRQAAMSGRVAQGTERKLQLWTVLPSGERQGREVSGRGAPTGRLSFQRSSRIPRAQVQKARLQDDILGREAAEELAHPCQPAPLPRLRAQRPGGEDNEDVLERTRPELPLPRFRWYVFRVFLTSRHLTSRFQRLP
jgi:hypothetical protein